MTNDRNPRSTRLRESLRDTLLSYLEFHHIISSMDYHFNSHVAPQNNNSNYSVLNSQKSGNNAENYQPPRRMIANKKYTVIVSNLIEEYGSELITLNEKFIRAVAGIQKKFLGGGNRAEHFVEDFCRDVGHIGDRIMAWRDAEFGQ